LGTSSVSPSGKVNVIVSVFVLMLYFMAGLVICDWRSFGRRRCVVDPSGCFRFSC
jgi:hypothetical protein